MNDSPRYLRTRTFLDAGHERCLQEQGYAVLDLLSEREANELLGVLAALEPADGFSPDGTGENQGTYHCTFLDANPEYKRRANEIIRTAFQPLVDQHLDAFQILTSNLYVKPPGAGRFEIHQNWPTTPDISDTTVTIWCPLVPATRQNGTIQIVPASHKIVPDIASVGAEKYFDDFSAELIEEWLRPVELRAGEAIIFDDSLLHWSAENRDASPRWAIQIEVVPVEVQAVMPYFATDIEPPRFEFYAVDADYFVDHSISSVRNRPADIPLVATVEHVNRRIGLLEFVRLMDAGPAIRRSFREHGAPYDIRWSAGWPQRS